jgi:hypothetical protein
MSVTPLQVRLRSRRRTEQGVASLVVVAALFLIMSLVAAYTNRNLIFEQRTSGNQYRSTQAFEAAEAGVEWALAQLNTGRITDDCAPSVDATDTSFRQRYLAIDGSNGMIVPLAPNGAGEGTLWPSCVFTGGNWSCACPAAAGAPGLAAATGAAFRVRFARVGAQPGIVRVDVHGCTRPADACLDFPAQSIGGEGRASLSVLVALRSALPALPIAALTVRQGLDVSGADLGAYNAEVLTSGVSILAGGPVNTTALRLGSTPGTPGELSVTQNDTGLQLLGSADRMFENVYAIGRNGYQQQPGVVVLDCGGGSCDAATVRAAAQMNPGRPIWAPGNVNFDDGADIGSAAEPVLVLSAGSFTFSSGTVYGMLYSQAGTWDSSGAGEVVGAGFAEGSFGGSATTTFVYDRAVLLRLQLANGTFVRAPGGWSDFKGL